MPTIASSLAEHTSACPPGAPRFVVQKHWASRLHYDFRLELGGVMKSWAVPKGPSYDLRERRLAVPVEDHPLSYNDFEGKIAEGHYGAGRVIVWDKGCWQPLHDPYQGLDAGRLAFALHGHKLVGAWALIRMQPRHGRPAGWLLVKERDGHERPAGEFNLVDALPDSVAQLPDCPAPAPLLSRRAPAGFAPP